MNRPRWSSSDRILLVVALAVVVAVPLAVSQFSVGPRGLTAGTAIVGSALLIGSIALPALLLSRWQTATTER